MEQLSNYSSHHHNNNNNQNQSTPNDAYDYIKRRLKSDIKQYLLSFQPDNQQYQQFTDYYKKCTDIIIKFIVNCTNEYYKELFFCLTALLGFGESPFLCEIFIRPNYRNQTKQQGSTNYKWVQQIPQSNPYQTHRGYGKRGKHKFNDQNTMNASQQSDCQLNVIESFFDNFKYFQSQIKGRAKSSKIGVFDFKSILNLCYNCGKNAQLKTQNLYYGNNLHQMIKSWVNNLDPSSSFEQSTIGDDLNNFTKLFQCLEDLYDKYIKQKSSNHIRIDQDLLQIKLTFCLKLLNCTKMDRRVQALSLIKMVLEKARADDTKYKNNNATNEWSTKSHHKKRHHNNNNNSFQNGSNTHNNNNNINQSMDTLRDQCSSFILKQQVLNLLMSRNYIHENLLQRLQPIIDVLCETKQINMEMLQLLFRASADKHSVEMIQFNKLYLSLSKQLSASLCRKFYEEIIDKRFQIEYKTQNQIEESHLEFVARYTNNYIDKSKSYKFKGIEFLKQYAIYFDDYNISSLHLRQFAFKKIEILLQKQSMKNHIKSFVIETVTRMSKYIANDTQTSGGATPVDLTYVIEGIDNLLKTKNVGKSHEQDWNQVADACANQTNIECRGFHDLLVKELQFWYWNCTSFGFDNIKRWKSKYRKDFKLRFDFLITLSKKTGFPIRDYHVTQITNIPKLEKKIYGIDIKQNELFKEKLNELHYQQYKLWLNECVKTNKQQQILESNAIKIIFDQQFDADMDINGFKSWLAYFHDLNKGWYDLTTNQYYLSIPEDTSEIEGYPHMAKVIESSTRKDVVVNMIDELILLHHHQGLQHSNDGDIHIPRSNGISNLIYKCHQVFDEYNKQQIHESKQELKAMRYALLLRRIIEYSIGKQSVFSINSKINVKYMNSRCKFQITWTRVEIIQQNNRYNNNNQWGNNNYNNYDYNQQPREKLYQSETFDVDCIASTSILDIRKRIAHKLNYKDMPRAIQLYRKCDNKFILIEEQCVKYLTYLDLAIKKKIELQVRIKTASSSRQERQGFPSFADQVGTVWDHFIGLQRLLQSKFFTTSLSGYYVLRYLPYKKQFRDDILAKCGNSVKTYFDVNRPLLNIYNIDTLRYYADLKCITNDERQQKEKTIRNLYNKNVFDVLFKIWTDKTFDKTTQLSGIHRLLWIEQFNRLCGFFYDVKVKDHVFKRNNNNSNNNNDSSEWRVISGHYGQSNQIMETLVNALNILLLGKLPNVNLTLFDITSPKHIEIITSKTIHKCFVIAQFLIMNKGSYLDHRRKYQQNTNNNQRQDELEDILLNGLEKMGDLQRVILNGRLAIREALYAGIDEFMSYEPNKRYIQRILGILVNTIPTNVTNETRHCSKFFVLLIHLIISDPKSSQKFIPHILKYIFEKLNTLSSNKNNEQLLSLLECGYELYRNIDKSINPEHVDVETIESHIELLMNKCLFGQSDANKTKININNQILLCPSGTPQRQQAFKLLFGIINRYGDIGKIQTKLSQKLLSSLGEHLNITTKNIVITNDNNDDDQNDDQKYNNNDHTDNRRKDFVGLVNLGCTCYLNSILQQLFMVPSFTNEMLSIESPVTNQQTPQQTLNGNGNKSNNKQTPDGNGTGINGALLYELQRVLLALRESQKKYLNPKDLCGTVNNAEGKPIDLWEQTDCQESLVALLHQLEYNLKQISPSSFDKDTLLDDHFGCKLRYLVKCSNGHVTKRDEKHMSLALSVKDTPNISDAFDKFTEAEVLDGDNKYQCSKCNKKVAAVRRQTIYKPPKQLILCLKRFEWNFETGGRQKLNTRFEFEPVINIRKYLNTNFPEEEADDNDDEEESKYSDDDNDNNNKDDDLLYIYDLVGIVIHQGQADRGHYYAYIKDRNTFINSNNNFQKEQWYEFNDKNVNKRDYNYIQKEAFGGATTVKIEDESKQNQNNRNRANSNNPWNKKNMNQSKPQSVEILSERNAYVLFYEQRAVKHEQKKKMKQQQKERKTTNGNDNKNNNDIDMEQPWKNVKYLNNEYDRINKENINIFRQQTLYDKDFVGFMKEIYDKILNNTKLRIGKNVNKVLLRFVFNVVPIEIMDNTQIKWWWRRLTTAVDNFTDEELRAFIFSQLLPSYLMNIFGKYNNTNNRQQANIFFDHVIKEINKRNMDQLLDKLLSQLIIVVTKWRPLLLSQANMEEIIELICCIDRQNKKYFIKYQDKLIDAIIKLISDDIQYPQLLDSGAPSYILQSIPSSNSNLNTKIIIDLLWQIICINKENKNMIKKLNDKIFLTSLIAKDYCVNQVNIVRFIANENIESFKKIIEIIHRRMAWLDFYDIFGALHIFNGLFDNENDTSFDEKSHCLITHLQKIVSNNRYWKITAISIQLLSQLCKNNILVKSFIQNHCFQQLDQLKMWCQKNKKFNNNNNRSSNNRNNRNNRNYRNNYNNNQQQNIKFYRNEPEFNEKDAKQRRQSWINFTNDKIRMVQLDSNLQKAFNIINKRD